MPNFKQPPQPTPTPPPLPLPPQKHNPRMTFHVTRSFFQVGFYKPLSTICVFVGLYSCVCICAKNIMKCLLFIIIYIFSTHYAINLFYWHDLKRKQTIEQQPHHACEWNRSKCEWNKSKTKSGLIPVGHTYSFVRFIWETMHWYH